MSGKMNSKMNSKMKVIKAQKHRKYTMELNKVSLSTYDDKHWIKDDGVSSLAYGYYRKPKVSAHTPA